MSGLADDEQDERDIERGLRKPVYRPLKERLLQDRFNKLRYRSGNRIDLPGNDRRPVKCKSDAGFDKVVMTLHRF